MAVSPLDLQTLFAQLDKVGKEQSAAREGAALHKAVHDERVRRKTEEELRAVVKAEQTGEGLSGVADNDARGGGGGPPAKKKHAAPPPRPDATSTPPPAAPRYKDPALGGYLDISG